jgi:hypothetical protein
VNPLAPERRAYDNRRMGHGTRSTILLTVAAGLLALVVVACGGAGGGSGTTLKILAGTVEVQASAGADFAPADDGQALREGSVVRTGSDGRAAIEWLDGSETRLDYGTTFRIATLESPIVGGTRIEGEQTTGSTYNRVVALTEQGDRFSVDTPTASAAVQGTTFAVIVEPDGSTTVIVTDSSVVVTTSQGEIVVPAGTMVTVDANGDVEGPSPIPQSILNGDWIRFNEGCDQGDCEVAIGSGDLASIEISPADATINLGESQAYGAAGFDDTGAPLGQVQAVYDLDGVPCGGSTCTPTAAGDYTVTATYGGFTATANLTVLTTGDVQVTLDWSAPVDLDLWVTDPNGDTVAYDNSVVASGGYLDRDAYALCDFSDSPPENIVWDASAPSGEYTVTVDVYDMCSASSVTFTLTVRVGGRVVLDVTDTLTSTGDQHEETFRK